VHSASSRSGTPLRPATRRRWSRPAAYGPGNSLCCAQEAPHGATLTVRGRDGDTARFLLGSLSHNSSVSIQLCMLVCSPGHAARLRASPAYLEDNLTTGKSSLLGRLSFVCNACQRRWEFCAAAALGACTLSIWSNATAFAFPTSASTCRQRRHSHVSALC